MADDLFSPPPEPTGQYANSALLSFDGIPASDFQAQLSTLPSSVPFLSSLNRNDGLCGSGGFSSDIQQYSRSVPAEHSTSHPSQSPLSDLDLGNYESTADAHPSGAAQPSQDPLLSTIIYHTGGPSTLGHTQYQPQIPYGTSLSLSSIQSELSTSDLPASSGLATTSSQVYGRNRPPHVEGPRPFPHLQEPSPYQASRQLAVALPTPTFEVFAMDKDKGQAHKGHANKGKGRARQGAPIRHDSIITARPDTKITLRVEFSSESHDPIPWDGLVIPRTYSVKRSERRTLQQPVRFRLLVYGASSPAEEPWNVCNKCRTNEYQRRYKSPPTPEQLAQFEVDMVDFDAPDPSIILQGGSADVDFQFRCYPNHKSRREERFKVVAELYGDNVTPTLYEIRSTFELHSHAKWKVKRLPVAEGILHSDNAGAQGGGLSVGFAAPVESSRSIPSTHSSSHHILHSAMPTAEAHQTTRLENRQSPEYVTPPVSPRHPSPEPIPPTPAQEQERERESPAPVQTAPTDPIPITNNTPVTVLHSVNPRQGPTSGEILISLYVSNLDPETMVYPRFGCNVGRVAYRRTDYPGGLLCDLPKAVRPGVVKVTLSLSDSADAPEFGESRAKFTYVVGMSEAVGLLLQIFTNRLLPAAFAWLQRFMQEPTTRALDAVTPQPDGNDVEGSSTRVLPELAFIETLSTIQSLPDFSQRLATVNEYGQTLLHLAVHLSYRKLVQQLVEWGVGLDVQDINGSTALHCAYLCEDDLSVTILKQGGASVSIFDALGRLPSDLLEKPVAINPDVEIADAADVGPQDSATPEETSLYLWGDILKSLQNGWDPREEIEKYLTPFFKYLGDRKFRCLAPIREGKLGEMCGWEGLKRSRTISHICGHLTYSAWVCGGTCGQPTCTQRFSEKHNLEQHAKPDPVQCPKCNKHIEHKRNLKKHIYKCREFREY